MTPWTPEWFEEDPILVVADSLGYRGETSPTFVQSLMRTLRCGSVGSFADNTSYAPFPYWSEGHGGYTTTMLLSGLATWKHSWTRKPRRAIVYAGINDIAGANGETYSQATTMARHASIRELILGVNPGCDVYHGLLIPLAAPYLAHDANRLLLNAALSGAGWPIIDFPREFDAATMLVDGLHPNQLGADHMAEVAVEDMGLAA
jgi:hypothetical protein